MSFLPLTFSSNRTPLLNRSYFSENCPSIAYSRRYNYGILELAWTMIICMHVQITCEAIFWVLQSTLRTCQWVCESHAVQPMHAWIRLLVFTLSLSTTKVRICISASYQLIYQALKFNVNMNESVGSLFRSFLSLYFHLGKGKVRPFL